MARVPARTVSIPAPTGGWDAQNALADMPPENAVVMDNMFPTTDTVRFRKGYTEWIDGMTGNVDTLMTYRHTNGAHSMFAANGTSIYDVTTTGSVGAADVTSLSNAQWQYTQIGTSGGNFLFAVNGADTPRTYNGSTWGTSSITGPTSDNLIWCNVHQRRLWFGEEDSLVVWYLPINSVSGTAASFDLSGIASLGGYIMAMGTWTRDAGDGSDDVAVFLTSEGEAIVYQGTDPDSATTWALIGVFRIGEPIGRRCMTKAGADLIIITEDGFVAVSTILAADRSQAERVALSQQINKAVSDAVLAGKSLFGWQPHIYTQGQMLIFNVPTSTTVFHQYVFNTITNRPCRFTGMNARCWGQLNEGAFFGGTDGKVYFSDNSNADDGSDIDGECLQAFSYLKKPGQLKVISGAEALLESSVSPAYALEVNTDFNLQAVTATATTSSTLHGSVYGGWRGIAVPPCYAVAPRIKISTQTARPEWVATNLMYVEGGML